MLCYREEMAETIANVKNEVYPTMNRTKYLLAEFSPHGTNSKEEMEYCLKYVLDKGYVPIIAHAERYKTLYNDPLEDLIFLRELGCFVQINLYSVEQDRGHVGGGSRKELANLFLKNHLVDFVGTDSHRPDYKSPEAAIGAKAIEDEYGHEYAKSVLSGNAERVLMTNIHKHTFDD